MTTPTLRQKQPLLRRLIGLPGQCWGPEPLTILAPGLAVVAALAAIAFGVNKAVPVVSALVVAVVLGAIMSNTGKLPGHFHAGIAWSGKKLLRLGVVLLGFRLTLQEIADLGPRGLGLVILVVTFTFFGTQWLGKRLGLSPSLSLLVATGFSICGASAIAAMRGVTPEAEDEDVIYAIALVTICGTLAILVLPIVGRWLGFEGSTFGAWIGASVHDVAQTIATASAVGGDSVKETAIVVKLTRVVLLAPLVTGVSLNRRRTQALHKDSPTAGQAMDQGADTGWAGVTPPVLPLFVACFLAAIAMRSTGLLPTNVLKSIKIVETLLFAAALVGLGAGVRIGKLAKVGPRPLILGLSSWVLIAAVSALGVRLIGL